MGKKDQEVFEMYSNLLQQESYHGNSISSSKNNFDEEDGEMFITSKEIAKQKEEFEKVTGSDRKSVV